MGPELFDPKIKDHRRTKYSDCYALGMVIYEVLGLHVPFYEDSNFTVVVKMGNGDRPERPREVEGVAWFTDDVWELLNLCWTAQPGSRPSVEDVLRCLEKFSKSWKPPSVSVTVPPALDSPARNTSGSTVSTLSIRVELIPQTPHAPFSRTDG